MKMPKHRGLFFSLVIFSWFVSGFPQIYHVLPGLQDAQACPDSFQYRKKLTSDSGRVGTSCSSNIADFPVLVSLSGDWLKTTTQDPVNGRIENTDGYDILFRALDDSTCGGVGNAPCTLDHEIEKYDGTAGTLVAWVRIPSLDYNDDTEFYIYYGNSCIGSATENPTAVWDDDFKAVWHFSETVDDEQTTGTHTDSTSHGYHGSQNGNNDITGKIAEAQDFDGINDYIDISSMNPQTYDDFTISAWYKSANTSVSDDEYLFVHKKSGVGETQILFGPTDDAGQTDNLRLLIEVNGGGNHWYYSGPDIVDQQWHYVVGVRDGNRIKMYVDGIERVDTADLDSGDSLAIDSGSGPYIGDDPGDTEQVDGMIDEMRISGAVRSACWIETEYNNQYDPTKDASCTDNGFICIGSEESTPLTAVTLTSFTAIRHATGILLRWDAGLDVNNLGWHVYREVGGKRIQLTPGLIAGSALMFGPGIRLQAGSSYQWWDPAGRDIDRYWIEDRDLNGQRTWHGPVTPVMTDKPLPKERYSTLLSQTSRTQTAAAKRRARLATRRVRRQNRTAIGPFVTTTQTPQPWETSDLPPHDVQHHLAAAPAVQLLIREPGFYRVTQPDLVLAGLDPNVDPRRLQLFVDGQQQAIVVRGEEDGRFDPLDAIEFYGVALDTPWTDTHTYWLVAGFQPGNRIPVESSPMQGTPPPPSFPATVDHKDLNVARKCD